MNRCFDGGSLVNGETPLPEDFTDYYAHPSLALIGCNRLFCRGCNSWVRSWPGLGFARPNMDVDLNALYERPDLKSAPELVETYPHFRLYLCRCSRWLEAFGRKAYDPDPSPGTDPTMPWQCGGHPLLTLPAEIDGAALANEADAGPLARRALAGFAGPLARPRDAAIWTARLYARLQGGPAADLVAAAAAERLTDADPAVRGRAIQFFFVFPLPVGVTRILDALEGDRSLYAGVPTEPWEWRENRTLEDSLWWVVAEYLDKNERVRELARREVTTEGKGRPLYVEMMQKDGPWMIEHVEAIVRANPALLPDLLSINWKDNDSPRALLRKVAEMPEVPAQVLQAFADKHKLGAKDRDLIAAHVAKRTPR